MSREPLLEEYKKQNPLNYVPNAMSSLHLCAFSMREAQSLFADENALDWAFSKRKGLRPNTSQSLLTDKKNAIATSIKNDNFVNGHVRDFKQD
jgi:hypothetical protein